MGKEGRRGVLRVREACLRLEVGAGPPAGRDLRRREARGNPPHHRQREPRAVAPEQGLTWAEGL